MPYTSKAETVDPEDLKIIIMAMCRQISSPYNDGWTAAEVKHDLYQFRYWLDEVYAKLPTFKGEDRWEGQRVMDVLRK